MDPVTAPTVSITGSEPVTMGYGSTLAADANEFQASLAAAETRISVDNNTAEQIAKAAFQPLDYINQEAATLSDYAQAAVASGNELTPAEIVSLTVQSQKFMFHSQLTANVANRSADGVQQLFRQQG
jgi:hypothetical protein